MSRLWQNSPSQDHEHCKKYLNALKASMVKIDDFGIVVTDNEGNWKYMGYGRTESGNVRNGYGHRKGGNILQLFRTSMASTLPAVVIMDRMVMAPQQIHDAFEKSRELSGLSNPWIWVVCPRRFSGFPGDPRSCSADKQPREN